MSKSVLVRSSEEEWGIYTPQHEGPEMHRQHYNYTAAARGLEVGKNEPTARMGRPRSVVPGNLRPKVRQRAVSQYWGAQWVQRNSCQ